MIELNAYFQPLSQGVYSAKNRWETTQLGNLIKLHTHDYFPELKFAEVAIFSIQEYDGSENSSTDGDCRIRQALYKLHFDNLPRVVDLGSLNLLPERKDSFALIEKVCSELLRDGILPLIIGGGQDISYAVYKAYASIDKVITFTSVDREFDIGLEEDKLASHSFLGKIIAHKPSCLFHFTNLSYQSFYVSPLAIDMLESMNFDVYRLGSLKSNMHEIEPVMRNTDFLSLDISAIKFSYSRANVYSGPNGLSGEDACKIMRYAGISDKLSSLGIFEYNQNLDQDNQTSQLISQMIWYFLEGYKNRKQELNPNLSNCLKYTVAFEDGKHEIVFYKSRNTGRWWMGVPFKSSVQSLSQNYFVACSYQDYETANRGEVPERWFKTFQKFS